MARFGSPLNIRVRSSESVAIIEPTLGISVDQPSVDAPLGSTPNSENWIFRDGAMEPRPMLSLRNTSPQVMGNAVIAGAYELTSVGNSRFPIISNTTRHAVYGQAATPNGWSVLSYVSAFGLNDPPNLSAGADYWDYTQIYWPLRDENIAVMAAGSYQTLYVTQSDTTVFSSMTGAPRAKFVASLDNYVLAFNIRDGSSDYVQRVKWPDRGDPSNWTGGLSGFEDLMSMKGQGTRVIVQDNKFLLFSDEEIWQGVPRDFPFVFSFQPYDTTRGCPYSRTIANTPLGTLFLGKDYQVYLLPKGGGQSQPIGQRLHKSVRNLIDQPARAWAKFDNTYGQYQLHYPIQGGSGYPQRAVFLDINTGSWAPQSYDRVGGGISLTAGHEIRLSSSATTYGGAGAVSLRYADVGASYAEMGGASEVRVMLAGSSNGTAYYFNSNATSDNGTAVECKWLSTGLLGEDPSEQKTLQEFRVDYQADSASSLTVNFSQTLGASFGAQSALNLPAVSGLSQSIAYPHMSARYPSFQISTQGHRPRIFRMWLKYKRGGR